MQQQEESKNIPNKFKHVKFTEGNYKLVQDETPKLNNDQLLIKVLYSSVNYYDKILMNNKKCENYCLGAEGCGTIQWVGKDLDQNLLGKKVAFQCDGWGEYAVKKRDDIIIFDDDVDLKYAIDAFINPLSALCLRRIVLQGEHRSCIIDGAACHLGRTLIQLLRESDVEVVAIVRSEDSIQEFKDKYNLKWVINQNAKDLDDQMKNVMQEAEPCMYISCVGGDLTGRIFRMMPFKSTLLIVGNLSNQDLHLPVTQLFIEGKKIQGFFLERYLKEELSQANFNQFCEEIKKDFKEGGKKFAVEVTREMDLKDWDKALNELDNIHGGKILLHIGA